jgi:hypothetical protein
MSQSKVTVCKMNRKVSHTAKYWISQISKLLLFMQAKKSCNLMESRTLKMLDMIVLTALYEYLTLNPGLSII